MPKSSKIPVDFVPIGSRLSFVERTTYNGGHSKAMYKCTCGNTKEINIGNVKRGKQMSCGCYGKEVYGNNSRTHGLSKHPLFKMWVEMKSRCYIPNRDSSKYYFDKGVKVCDEWVNDFKCFYDWAISNGWERGLQLDKDKKAKELNIPNNIYSPIICSFLTPSENSTYRSTNRWLTLNGVTKTMTQWEREKGLTPDIIFSRLKSGWSTEDAICKPIMKGKNKKTNVNS